MDPEETHLALSCQGALLGQHEKPLQARVENSISMTKAMKDLMQQLSHFAASTPYPTVSTASAVNASQQASSASVFKLEPFHGDLDKCQGFCFNV